MKIIDHGHVHFSITTFCTRCEARLEVDCMELQTRCGPTSIIHYILCSVCREYIEITLNDFQKERLTQMKKYIYSGTNYPQFYEIV